MSRFKVEYAEPLVKPPVKLTMSLKDTRTLRSGLSGEFTWANAKVGDLSFWAKIVGALDSLPTLTSYPEPSEEVMVEVEDNSPVTITLPYEMAVTLSEGILQNFDWGDSAADLWFWKELYQAIEDVIK